MKPWSTASNALVTVQLQDIVDVFDQEPGKVIPEAARKRLRDRIQQNNWAPFDENSLIVEDVNLPIDPDAGIVKRRAGAGAGDNCDEDDDDVDDDADDGNDDDEEDDDEDEDKDDQVESKDIEDDELVEVDEDNEEGEPQPTRVLTSSRGRRLSQKTNPPQKSVKRRLPKAKNQQRKRKRDG